MHIGHGALAGVAKMLLIAFTDAAHISAMIVALLRVELVASGADMLAGTGTQHLQINDHAFVNAHRIDLNGLPKGNVRVKGELSIDLYIIQRVGSISISFFSYL